MAADKHGHELKVGDKVWIGCTIVAINDGQENNLSLETEEVIAPGRNKVALVIGSAQVTCGKKTDHTRGFPDPAEDDPHFKHPKK